MLQRHMCCRDTCAISVSVNNPNGHLSCSPGCLLPWANAAAIMISVLHNALPWQQALIVVSPRTENCQLNVIWLSEQDANCLKSFCALSELKPSTCLVCWLQAQHELSKPECLMLMSAKKPFELSGVGLGSGTGGAAHQERVV